MRALKVLALCACFALVAVACPPLDERPGDGASTPVSTAGATPTAMPTLAPPILTAPSGGADVAISSSGLHTCALRADGSPVCWGRNWFGQATPPAGERFTAISSGVFHTCALRADGSPVCWGNDVYGQTTPPTGERFTVISNRSSFYTCALRADGSPVCWGDDALQGVAPAGERFTAISSSGLHTCALRADGSPVCWGNDDDGAATPPVGERFTAISSGGSHTCALRADGSPVCWGNDDDGAATPPAGERFTAISSGTDYTCALRGDGIPVCWGNDDFGQATPLGPAVTSTPVPSSCDDQEASRGHVAAWDAVLADLMLATEKAVLASERAILDISQGTPADDVLAALRGESGAEDFGRIADDLRRLGEDVGLDDYRTKLLEIADALDRVARLVRDGYAGDIQAFSRAGEELSDLQTPIEELALVFALLELGLEYCD